MVEKAEAEKTSMEEFADNVKEERRAAGSLQVSPTGEFLYPGAVSYTHLTLPTKRIV